MRRILTIAVITLLAVIIGGLGVALLTYPPEYVYRLLAWRNSDVGDIERFAATPLAAASDPFTFADARDDDRVRRVFASLDQAADLGGTSGAGAAAADLDAFLADADTQAFIVIQDGRVLYEGYFDGATRDTVVTSFSVGKSFTSALVGIAVAEGSIESLDDPITAYLPELEQRDAAFTAVTVRHLLSMSSGIRYEEVPFFHGDDAKTYYYPDLRTLALEETKIEGPPDLTFHYNNYHPLLLGLILERATGVPVATYLEERLWRPLGMEYEGSWSIDSPEKAFPKMESGVNGRAIDFGKFGQLLLDGGRWGGEQLIPAEWVELSTTPHGRAPGYYPDGYTLDEFSLGYGLMWWTLDVAGDAAGAGDAGGTAAGDSGDSGDAPTAPVVGAAESGRRDFMAWGKYGQIIFVSPDTGVVVVRNGAAEGISLGRWFRLLSEFADDLAR